MEKLYPKKLKEGDTVAVVAPSSSFGIISPESRDIAAQRFAEMGLKVIFGEHVEEIDEFNSSSITSRVADLHAAFSNPDVSAVVTVIGGFNCNQLLRYLDWELVRNNPKIFIGYSDTTALQNAMYAKTGLVTYSGPAYSTFAQQLHFDYTLEHFKKCLFSDEPFTLYSSDTWSDDEWYLDQQSRKLIENEGWWVIHEGKAEGTLLGANLCTFNLLQGTEYMPDLTDSVLFLEDDHEGKLVNFERDLQSLLHLPDFQKVRGIVIGRFQNASKVEKGHLIKVIETKKELRDIPVVANVDFGHTSPIITFPIGGECKVSLGKEKSAIEILKH